MQVLFNEQYGQQEINKLDEQSLSIQNLIEKLQEELNKAHKQLTTIDSHRQELKTTNQAAQSGLDQIEIAAKMIAHTYGEEGLDELSDRIAEILSAARNTQTELLESGDGVEDKEPQTIIVPPIPETTTEQDITTIDVTATEEVETEPEAEETTDNSDNDLLSTEEKEFIEQVTEDKKNENIQSTVDQIATKHFSKIKKAAKSLGIHGNGLKKAEMLTAIKAKLQQQPGLLTNLQAISQTL